MAKKKQDIAEQKAKEEEEKEQTICRVKGGRKNNLALIEKEVYEEGGGFEESGK